MVIILGIALTAVALAVLAYPILRRSTAGEGTATDGALAMAPIGAQPYQEQLEELLAQRDSAVQALRELSFDRQVGKISDGDFSVFETNLKLTAAGAFRSLDEWEKDADNRLGAPFAQDQAARVSQMRAGNQTCPGCGRRVLASDSFCAGCGAALQPTPAAVAATAPPGTCPNCGRTAEPGDRFCAGCGKPLPEMEKALAR